MSTFTGIAGNFYGKAITLSFLSIWKAHLPTPIPVCYGDQHQLRNLQWQQWSLVGNCRFTWWHCWRSNKWVSRLSDLPNEFGKKLLIFVCLGVAPLVFPHMMEYMYCQPTYNHQSNTVRHSLSFRIWSIFGHFEFSNDQLRNKTCWSDANVHESFLVCTALFCWYFWCDHEQLFYIKVAISNTWF